MKNISWRKLLACVAYLCSLFVSWQVTAEIESLEVEGIPNYSQSVGEETFSGSLTGFGGNPQQSAMVTLKDGGFASVIALRFADEKNADIQGDKVAASEAGLKYFHLPFSPQQFSPATIEQVLETLADPENQPVFIHCNSATRVAALWMIGRIQLDDLSVADAGKEARMIASDPEAAIAFSTSYLSASGR